VADTDLTIRDIQARAVIAPIKRRTLGVSVASLLGGTPTALPAYDSYGMIDPKVDEKAIMGSLESGFRAIKIKLGEGGIENDVNTARAVRSMIGPAIKLMVDYNQSLDPVEACQRLARLAEFDLCWVEEPVKAEDLEGHARVAGSAHKRLPLNNSCSTLQPRCRAPP
jgi:mandelate racemase